METNFTELLKKIDIDVKTIADPALRNTVILLLNIVEHSATVINELRKENQLLRDEINRMKGEQGKPTIRSQKKPLGDVSSERERKNKQGKKKIERKKT